MTFTCQNDKCKAQHPDKPDTSRPTEAGQILSGQVVVAKMPSTGRRVRKEKGAE